MLLQPPADGSSTRTHTSTTTTTNPSAAATATAAAAAGGVTCTANGCASFRPSVPHDNPLCRSIPLRHNSCHHCSSCRQQQQDSCKDCHSTYLDKAERQTTHPQCSRGQQHPSRRCISQTLDTSSSNICMITKFMLSVLPLQLKTAQLSRHVFGSPWTQATLPVAPRADRLYTFEKMAAIDS